MLYKSSLGYLVFSDTMYEHDGCYVDERDDARPRECYEVVDPNNWDTFKAWCEQEKLNPSHAESVRKYFSEVE